MEFKKNSSEFVTQVAGVLRRGLGVAWEEQPAVGLAKENLCGPAFVGLKRVGCSPGTA